MIDKTYIINLANRADKKLHMMNQLNILEAQSININPVFFDAINGNCDDILSQHQFRIQKWCDPFSGKAMTGGEIGCALSHYKIWCDICKNSDKDSVVLILEDDVIFEDNFMERLKISINEIDTEYDMLYLNRKPLNIETERLLSEHICLPNKSYWTCAYILRHSGAVRLIDSNYINNIIPVDEFLPIMYGCDFYGYERFYPNSGTLKCLSVNPHLLRLTENSFYNSDTYHSQPISKFDKYDFKDLDGVDKTFVVIFIGRCKGDSYDRLMYYFKIYGLSVIAIDNTFDSNLNLLSNELNNWTEYDIDSTLILLISINNDDYCNVLNIAPPQEIIYKYYQLVHRNHNQIITINTETKNDIVLVWSHQLINILKYSTFESIHNILLAHFNNDVISDDHHEIFLKLTKQTIITFDHKKTRVVSSNFKMPCIVFASKEFAIMLNHIENYTATNWNEYYGYCMPNTIISNLPKIYLAINDSSKKNLSMVNYPRELLTISILNNVTNGKIYQDDIDKFLKTECQYYFFIDKHCILTNPETLNQLLKYDKAVIAPMIKRDNSVWSNFWGDLDDNGYYKRSIDYLDIVTNKRRGCWNVPYISGIYLMKRQIFLHNLFLKPIDMDVDMRMCYNLRSNDLHMYVTNMHDFGYINDITFESQIETDAQIEPIDITLFDILDNKRRQLWEKKYLHPLYREKITNLIEIEFKEICDGIYIFPLFSEIFCKEIIELSETFGDWSQGKNQHRDSRFGDNYYENVPTVDVQLFQLDLEKQWQQIVYSYIAPVANLLYNNYQTKDINLAFIVKYHYQDQPALSAHHDASTYTVNIALNHGNGIDYEGGGCRFIRQNITVKNQNPGMCCIHPGKLTAYHEGLPISSGTRYILVSFIN